MDLFLDPSAANIRAAVRALEELFDDPALAQITPEEMERYGLIRYGLTDYDFVIDLTSRLGEAVQFADLEAAPIDFLGEQIPVASPGALIRMKEAAGRPQDLLDVACLRERFGLGG